MAFGLKYLFPRGESALLLPTSTLFMSPICQAICQHTAVSRVPGLCQILIWEAKQSCLKSLAEPPPYNDQNPALEKPAPPQTALMEQSSGVAVTHLPRGPLKLKEPKDKQQELRPGSEHLQASVSSSLRETTSGPEDFKLASRFKSL